MHSLLSFSLDNSCTFVNDTINALNFVNEAIYFNAFVLNETVNALLLMRPFHTLFN